MQKVIVLAVLVLALLGGVGVALANVTDGLPAADICCPQGSVPNCWCSGANAVPPPCPPGFTAIPGTEMCGTIVWGEP